MVFFCDFDGTITEVDVVDTFLEKFADKEYLEIEERWLKGEISSLECLQKQISLVKNVDKNTIDEFLNTVKIDPFFKDFVNLIKKYNGKVVILSDGFRYFIERILNNYGIKVDAILSNELVINDKTLEVVFPYQNPFCQAGMGNCKCKHSENQICRNKTFYIGDGRSDFCVASKFETVFAKGKLYQYLKSIGKNPVKIENFKDVINYLKLEEFLNGRKRVAST
ncbi:2,3-diketo-5-methylthio-1-phosphopentane phosphatase [Sulfurihydrogenibium azorense Az-Fu1]|uniref:phosphoserine phosphatase n=1 Tax=Sulfurihydrogenibium azorense (strain DSM 15241 / OCM 825 / Az-Fu1) TaxID=204536 RepID=C1DUD3_SULAA|nr:MtnX-like HAD-IB family phosphatase [Sulfurihydrogenibium azorense]ACN98941.1 2,3-diketo-5-methylthio-1-phosphopentane phosphatase [Sulfurihydrogenibium azorense Az-Fu1]